MVDFVVLAALRLRLTALCLAAAPCVASCAQDPQQQLDDDGDHGTPSPQTPPAFLQPASGVQEIWSSRLYDIRFNLADTAADTVLIIDGTSAGPLRFPGPLGQRTGNELLLRIDGATPAGTHILELQQAGDEGPLISDPIELVVLPDTRDLVLVLDDPLLFDGGPISGQALSVQGHADAGLLWVSEWDGVELPRMHLLRATDSSWDEAEIRRVELPGLAIPNANSLDALRPPAISAVVLQEDPTTLRIAWRTADHLSVDWRPLAWDTGETGAVSRALSIDAADFNGIEWAQLGRPHLFPGALIAELRAHADVENPLPGERRLMLVPWIDGLPADAQEFSTQGDIEILGTVFDRARAELDLVDRVAVRVGGLWTRTLELDPQTGMLSLPDPLDLPAPSMVREYLGVSTLSTALNTRTVVGVDAQGNVDAYTARLFARSASILAGTALDLPAATPTAAPAVGIVLGVPVILIPYGDLADLHLLTSDGEALRSLAITGVRCDAVALPMALDNDDHGEMAVACLEDGALRLGTLAALEIED